MPVTPVGRNSSWTVMFIAFSWVRANIARVTAAGRRRARRAAVAGAPRGQYAPARLEVAAEPGLPPALGHASQLEQVVVNLAMNARDAMPSGGTLAIRAEAGVQGGVRLSVCDDGCGMTPEVVERVFEPWFTTKAEGHGSGLGLPMVQRIVRDHGGRLELQSTPGRGTRVTLWLKAAG